MLDFNKLIIDWEKYYWFIESDIYNWVCWLEFNDNENYWFWFKVYFIILGIFEFWIFNILEIFFLV